jgi:hypothetical protein
METHPVEPPPSLARHLHLREGCCYPDWAAIWNEIEECAPEAERPVLWKAVVLAWVAQVQTHLGEKYVTWETDRFLYVSDAGVEVVQDADTTCTTAIERIEASLVGLPVDPVHGMSKRVVLLFADIDAYCRYIAYFHAEGESPMSSGICLDRGGYPHIAIPATDVSTDQLALAHELTHLWVSHLPLPLWLNEALAMRMEQIVCGQQPLHLDRDILDRHSNHWNEETIQEFWTGASWQIPGESHELSYALAQLLWLKIETVLAPPRPKLVEFIAQATLDDAGESAFQSAFDASLGDLVASILGEGPWSPAPDAWAIPDGSDSAESSHG